MKERKLDYLSTLEKLLYNKEIKLTKRDFMELVVISGVSMFMIEAEKPLRASNYIGGFVEWLSEKIGLNSKLYVYSNDIDWNLNKERLYSLPVPVKRVNTPYSPSGDLFVLGGPLAPVDENMPYNIVRNVYDSKELKSLRNGKRWAVKTFNLKGEQIVNVAGSSRYETKRGVEFLTNTATELDKIIRGENPVEVPIEVKVEEEPRADGSVLIKVDYEHHPWPLEAYLIYEGKVRKMYPSIGYFSYSIPNYEIGEKGLKVNLLINDIIDNGRCLYSN